VPVPIAPTAAVIIVARRMNPRRDVSSNIAEPFLDQ
jgi:hypothetical protein